ncbi:MAG: hypothetical protein KC503_04140 [Myxococcales bacterium]|nr:hypothetical protein [Myxococcales bacterium]
MRSLFAITFVLCAGCGAKVDYRGSMAADGRAFFRKAKYAAQEQGSSVSLVAEPEFYLQSKSERHLLTLRPFLRLDPIDQQRSHWDIRRADYVASVGDWVFGAGAGIFSWRVLSGVGVVDIINQIDFVEDASGNQKLGQPYARIAWQPGAWSFEIMALPVFRQPTFPGEKGRLRFAALVDTDSALYETRLGRWQPSFAARVAVNAGGFDIGLGLFSGVSRQPRLIAQITDERVVPAYDLTHQASLDVSWTIGPVVLKAEGFGRLWSRDLRFYGGAGGGIEYNFFDIAGSGVNLALLGEYYYDSRPADAPLTFFKNDAFLGTRLTLPDSGGTRFIVGAVTDVRDLRTYIRGQASRRFGNHFRVIVQVNAYVGKRDGLEGGLLRDDHAMLRLAYFL